MSQSKIDFDNSIVNAFSSRRTTLHNAADFEACNQDETKVEAVEMADEGGQSDGQATGRVEPALPFTVMLEQLNRSDLSEGAQIIANVQLTNSGRDAIAFPRVLRHEFGGGFQRADARQISLGISMIDTRGREHDLAGTVLRGSLSRSGAMQAIAPGETVTIRAPLWIPIVDDSEMSPAGGAAVSCEWSRACRKRLRTCRDGVLHRLRMR